MPAVPLDPSRTVEELNELRELTGDEEGAQRVAWTDTWVRAREWLSGKLEPLGVEEETDEAGNQWFTLGGASDRALLIGGHIDSVPNGGWLDGALNVLAGVEVLRRIADEGRPPFTVRLVNWADEEGARFGRSLFGSSAAAGSLSDQDELRGRRDADGNPLPDALARQGVDLDAAVNARDQLENAAAYLELHIEQGPVLESMNKSTGVVLGTFGVERNKIRFVGQAAHSGSTPIPMRRDAFLVAAETALECRAIALRHSHPAPGRNAVCTVGVVNVEPKIVTAVPGVCEISLDQRALDPTVLGAMLQEARAAADRAARANNVQVEWEPIWRIEPRPFDPALIQLCEQAVREETGDAPRLPSGPLHDAAEMAPHMPVVMMFASSSSGLSHCKEEDTPEEHLEKTIDAFLTLVQKTIASV